MTLVEYVLAIALVSLLAIVGVSALGSSTRTSLVETAHSVATGEQVDLSGLDEEAIINMAMAMGGGSYGTINYRPNTTIDTINTIKNGGGIPITVLEDP